MTTPTTTRLADVLVPDPLSEPEHAEAATFRAAMRRCAAGVVLVTEPGPAGLTITSFTSVSAEPPLVAFGVDRRAMCWPHVREATHFAVNVLADDQAEVATRFAVKGTDKFAPPTRWRLGPYGLPLIDGAAAYLCCRRYQVLPLGDHFLVAGLLTGTWPGSAGSPLLYHDGGYGQFDELVTQGGQTR
jgi:flavin reductase (DIM6/NTAB) family NADH-FMN oxidoreductase RutF